MYRAADGGPGGAAGVGEGADKEQEEIPGGGDNGAGRQGEGRAGRQVRYRGNSNLKIHLTAVNHILKQLLMIFLASKPLIN